MKRIFLLLLTVLLLFSMGCGFVGTCEKQFNMDTMLSKYEWFKNQYTSIQSSQKNIEMVKGQIKDFKDLYGDPKKWDWQTKESYNNLSTRLQGYISQYNMLVADYNAQSSKFNWRLFKGGLPIEIEEYKEK